MQTDLGLGMTNLAATCASCCDVTYIRICVRFTHAQTNDWQRHEILNYLLFFFFLTYFLFRKIKAKDVNVLPNTENNMSLSSTDPQLKELNYIFK